MSNRRENVVFEDNKRGRGLRDMARTARGQALRALFTPVRRVLEQRFDVAVGRARPETTKCRGIDRLIRGGSNAIDARDEHLLESARERMAKHHQIEHGDDRMRVQTTPLPRLGEIRKRCVLAQAGLGSERTGEVFRGRGEENVRENRRVD